jgi:hypothetical protein
MDTRTGEISLGDLAAILSDPTKLLLTDLEAQQLRHETQEERLAWLAVNKDKLRAAGRLPEQQGKRKWPKYGRAKARRNARRQETRDGPHRSG